MYDMVNMRIEALELAKRYINEEVNTSPDMKTFSGNLVHKYASLYAKQNNESKLEQVLSYMINREPEKIAEYWKVCGVYRRALKIYMDANMLSSALQLMCKQEWYDEGLRLAEECIRLAEEDQRLHEWLASFAIQKARSMLKQKTYMCPSVDKDSIAIKYLQHVCSSESLSKWHPITHLLLNCLIEDITLDKVPAKTKIHN